MATDPPGDGSETSTGVLGGLPRGGMGEPVGVLAPPQEGERIPLHRRIREHLRNEINQGNRPPYSELPSEQSLADAFDTTRMTVRQAVAALEHEGLVEKAQGRRTIVCPPREVESMIMLPHNTIPRRISGDGISYRLLHQELITPPSIVRERLKLPWTVERVVLFSRVRLVRGVSVSVYSSHLLADRCEGFLDEDMSNHSLTQVIRETYGMIPHRITHNMEVMTADDELSELLDVREGTWILHVESLECDEDETPLIYHVEYFRADRYRFKFVNSQPSA